MRWTAASSIRSVRPFSRKTSRNLAITIPARLLSTRTYQPSIAMRARRVSQAVLASAVAGSAWYIYKASNSVSRLEYSSSASQNTNNVNPTNPVGATRKALVVEPGALYTADIPIDQPLSKTDEYGRKVVEMLTPDQVTAKLRKTEESYFVNRGKGVVRYDIVAIPSNNPIEDDHVEQVIQVPQTPAQDQTASDWMFWGVFDGHVGWTTSAKLRQTLVSYVARELNTTYTNAQKQAATETPEPSAVDLAIKTAFLRLDNDIVHGSVQKVLSAQSKPLAAQVLAPAISGACALLSFYDSRTKELRVACAGDSRAVLGRRGDNGKWTATALSIDQTGGTSSEKARLSAEHPNEPMVTANGRILGSLEPSRSFGDATYKWSRDVQDKLHQNYFGRRPNKHLLTPPYVTAEPVVTTTKIKPERDDFVVMATDGLWEMLTNDEVVGLVGMWLERQTKTTDAVGSTGAAAGSSWLSGWFGNGNSTLPIESTTAAKDKSGSAGQRAPIRQDQWGVQPDSSNRFIVEDKNAATHLVRNALGGKDRDTVSALLTLTSPNSRRFRDDVTIEVIFFGQGPDAGKIELNRAASASADTAEIKPKL